MKEVYYKSIKYKGLFLSAFPSSFICFTQRQTLLEMSSRVLTSLIIHHLLFSDVQCSLEECSETVWGGLCRAVLAGEIWWVLPKQVWGSERKNTSGDQRSLHPWHHWLWTKAFLQVLGPLLLQELGSEIGISAKEKPSWSLLLSTIRPGFQAWGQEYLISRVYSSV